MTPSTRHIIFLALIGLALTALAVAVLFALYKLAAAALFVYAILTFRLWRRP